MTANRLFTPSLIVAAIALGTGLAGCSSTPTQNSALSESRALYNAAQTNPQVTRLAPLELDLAGKTLVRADAALAQGEDDAVDQLAYLVKQQVGIAEATARRKAAEAAVIDSTAARDRARLDARTAEADAARREVEAGKLEASRQAAELALADERAERNQAQLATQKSDAEAARLRALAAEQAAATAASSQSDALAAAAAQTERDQARIAQQAQQLKAMDAKETERGQVITLGDVLFSVNDATLSAGGQRNVQKLADFLNEYPERKVLVEGHTDSTGSGRLNQALSERRAAAVRSALMTMNVSGDRVLTQGLASAYPVATNDTVAGRQMNRRVEIIVSDERGMIPSR